MSQETIAPEVTDSPPLATTHRARFWPAFVIIGLFWVVTITAGRMEMPYFFRFLLSMAAPAVLLIAFSVWWWRHRSISRRERLFGYALVVGGAFVTGPLTHPSVGTMQALMGGLPIVITVWTLWFLVAERTRLPYRRLGSLALAAAIWSCFTLYRVEGVDGDLKPGLHWRWSPTAEELFLADTKAASASKNSIPQRKELALSPGDWPEFRGPHREGVVFGTSISTNWNEQPPKQLWKQRIGPAWSSVTIIGDLLFTQEQRGDREAVVCYSASNGKQLWVHEDDARFWESVSGAGPRGTPTFANGRLYTLGATGILNCLDAATGHKHWSHNLQTDAAAVIPLWGLSSSPLVTEGVVVVYGGGENHNNLLAYDAESGAAKWTAPAGVSSYASPHLVKIGGQSQILMLNDQGLMSVEPTQGRPLWTAGTPMPGAPRSLQPHSIGERQILIGSLVGMGLATFEIAGSKDSWTPTEKWASPQAKAEFSEFVIHRGNAYGFDGAIFCCVDIGSGERHWKGGRYGRGQVILLPDQDLLLVLSETGEAVLVSAQATKHEEIGRFQAVTGKTWNHPVIAHGRLYVRNAEEIACYQLEDSARP